MKGKVWKFGNDIDTDIIIPGRYLVLRDEKDLAEHVMEGIDSNFSKKVGKGDIIVAGNNFGCGSSREHAPIALKGAGISAVVAESFARIFYRNSINVGLPLIEAKGIYDNVSEGEMIDIDVEKGILKNMNTGKEIKIQELPEFMRGILQQGGLIPYLKDNLDDLRG
jgi:3-isopropylmalate/(R)-2-methylmalate dehydratase small subunit